MKFLLLVLFILSYSCNGIPKKTASSNLNATELADKSEIPLKNPNKEDIIRALEKAISFCKTANRKEFSDYLAVSMAQINTVSDEEFILIKEDNSYLYENLIDSLKNNTSSFTVLSNDKNIYEISFMENGNDSLTVVINFSYDKNTSLVLSKLNTI